MLLAFISTGSLLWGYGNLHRQVTLSPLETGRALAGAIRRISQDNQADLDVYELIELVGDTKVTWYPKDSSSTSDSIVEVVHKGIEGEPNTREVQIQEKTKEDV